jgi:hypothetical protein
MIEYDSREGEKTLLHGTQKNEYNSVPSALETFIEISQS